MSKDRRLEVCAALLGFVPFLLTVPLCGLYLDDYSFLRMLAGSSAADLWVSFLHYVPGRNLHIPFFYAIIELTRGSTTAMHWISLGFDALNAVLLFALVRRLTGLRSVALACAAIFAVAPNHGETHFWITLIPQCQIPVALILTAFLLASAPGGLLAACAAYAAALFTYDQVFFLWPLLLAVAWSRDRAPKAGRYAAAAAGLLALNGAHITARYLSPYASGGRPLIRLADFFHRCRDAAVAVGKGLVPWPTSSHAHWAWSVPLAILAVAAAAWLVRETRAQARGEDRALAAWTNGPGWLGAAAGGAVWTGLAYFPNLFWYLSPRHNLLPSIGWSLSLAAVCAYASSRSLRARAALPWLAGLFFAAAIVSDVHEGTQWIDSRRLRDSFDAAVLRLAPPVDTVFVVGAPRYLRRAPAFNLPHDVIMAAGRALGRPFLDKGDYEVSPTRRGIVYHNDLSIGPAESFFWLPAGEVNLLSYDASARRFDGVCSLRVEDPDGSARDLSLRPSPGCAAALPAAAEVSLLSSSRGPAAPAGGPALLRAKAVVRGETTVLELVWRVDDPPASALAYIPRVKDASGALVLDAVFPSRGAKRPYPMIWPLVDDLAAGLGLERGRTLRQTFALRRAPKTLGPGAVLELDAFAVAPTGSAVPLGTSTIPLSF